MITLMVVHILAIAAYVALYHNLARLTRSEKTDVAERLDRVLTKIGDETQRLACRFADELISGNPSKPWSESVRKLQEERLALLKPVPFCRIKTPNWKFEDVERACVGWLTREQAKIHVRRSRQLIQGTGVLALVTLALSFGIWANGSTDMADGEGGESPSALGESSSNGSRSFTVLKPPSLQSAQSTARPLSR